MKAKRVLGIVISLIMALTMTVTVPTTVFGSEDETPDDTGNPPVEKQEQEITFSEDIEAAIAEGESITVVYGDSVNLDAVAAGTLHYEPSDESVISVSGEGVVKGEGVGQATIEVIAEETEEYNAATPRVVAFEVVKAEQTITINNEVIPEVMAYHDTFELDAQAEGELSYVPSDDTVLSVTDKGVIRAEGIGTEKITINAAATENYQAAQPIEIEIEVVKADQEIVLDDAIESELADNDNTIAVEKGKPRSLNAKARSIVVDEVTNCEIVYDIDSPDNKVSINDAGVLTAEASDEIKEATVTMHAKAEGGYNMSASRKISVVVVDELDGILPASEFVGNGIDGFYARVITVIRTLTDGEWSVYQEATSEVINGIENLGGKIINGEIEIVSGYRFVKKDQTIALSDEFGIEEGEMTLIKGEKVNIDGLAACESGDIDYLFESQDEGVDTDEIVDWTEDEGCVIEPIGIGHVKLTITAEENDFYKAAEPVEINVSVKQRHSISLETDSFNKLTTEGPFPVGASLAEGDEAVLTYNSSDESVVKVDEEGTVTLVGPGKAQITITAPESGEYVETTAKADVTVIEAVQTITVPSTSYGKYIGEAAFSLGATFVGDPDNTLQYASSNPGVASVNKAGLVTILAPGSATITITAPATEFYKAATKNVSVSVYGLATPSLTLKALKKKKIKLTWTESPGASTYQIYTYVNKKTTTMTGNWLPGNMRTITNNKLKKRKTYKYKIRAVAYVNGVTYYSPWSKVKKAKCKK